VITLLSPTLCAAELMIENDQIPREVAAFVLVFFYSRGSFSRCRAGE